MLKNNYCLGKFKRHNCVLKFYNECEKYSITFTKENFRYYAYYGTSLRGPSHRDKWPKSLDINMLRKVNKGEVPSILVFISE